MTKCIFRFSKYQIGQVFKLERLFTENDIKLFSEVTTDRNPIHLDQQLAEKSIFKQKVIHGMLSASLFSALVGTNMPGAIYLDQTVYFKAPVFFHEPVTAQVKVIEIIEKRGKQILKLETTVMKPPNILAVTGLATILIS